MLPSNIFYGVILLFGTGIGALANLLLLSIYFFSFLTSHIVKPVNVIITHLTLANLAAILSKGGPEAFIALSGENFLDDVGCKLVFFIHKLAQALSICFACYLCNFQAIIISPPSSRWAKYKDKAPEYINPFCIFCCIFNVLIEIPVILGLSGPRSSINNTDELNFLHCSVLRYINAYLMLIGIRNALCVALILWAGGSMVLLLHRHHQQVQTIHSTRLSTRVSPEIKATQTILQLLCTFVFFYFLASLFVIFVSYFHQHRFWLLRIDGLISLCFPTVSPFVLLPPGARICPISMCKDKHSSSLQAIFTELSK